MQRIWVVVGGVASIVCVVILLRPFAAQYRQVALSELSLAQKNAEIDAAQEKLAAIRDNMSQGVSLFTDDQKLEFCNRRYCEIYDLPYETVRPGLSVADLTQLRIAAGTFQDEAMDDYLASIDRIVREGRSVADVSKLPNGRTVSRHCQPFSGHRWVVTHEDITERAVAPGGSSSRRWTPRQRHVARWKLMSGTPCRWSNWRCTISHWFAAGTETSGVSRLCYAGAIRRAVWYFRAIHLGRRHCPGDHRFGDKPAYECHRGGC